jgi:hypothetical protein
MAVVALVVVEALLGTAVTLVVLGIGPARAGAQAQPPSPIAAPTAKARNLAAEPLPSDCVPAAAGPPTSPYQLGLVGTVTGGSVATGSATVSGIDAKVCGLVTLVNGTPPCYATGYIVSPHDGQLYGALSIALTLVPGMNPTVGFTANPGTITGGFNCGSSQNGLSVGLNAAVSGSTAPLFGVSCTIAVTIPLGGAATGPLASTRATLTSNDFSVPAVQPSPTCPSAVAANVDDIAGLPLVAGRATATLPVTASIYQPAP